MKPGPLAAEYQRHRSRVVILGVAHLSRLVHTDHPDILLLEIVDEGREVRDLGDRQMRDGAG